MFKIGGVSLDVSHPIGFSKVLENEKIDMKYEYVCNKSFRGDEERDWFINRFNLKGYVDEIADMVDKVDIGFVQSCNWEKHLDQAMPFIEKGKPVFIDKPIIGSVKDAKRYKQLIDNGAKIIGSSSARHAQEIRDFLAIPISERGEVVNVFGTCGVDEFNYSIHIVEIFSEIAGCNAVECKYNGTAQREDGTKCENYTIRFENGILATYATVLNGWRPFQVTIMTTKGTYIFEIDVDKIYGALLREIYKYLSGKDHNLASCDTLINCSYIMMCGKKSRDEKKGAWVKLDELTDEDKFDGYEFEETYAKNASNIYKD